MRLFWFSVSDKGIYGSADHPAVLMHKSYHKDGNVHWKADGKVPISDGDSFFKKSGYSSSEKEAPLNTFKDTYSFFQAGMRLDPDCFQKGCRYYKFKKSDHVIWIDSRSLKGKQKHVNLYLDLVEYGAYPILNTVMSKFQKIFSSGHCEHHCYLEFKPWALVTLGF